MTDDDEEVIPGPLKAPGSKEEIEVARYKRPSHQKIAFRRKVLQTENWIRRCGIVPKDDVILYIMRAFDIERPQANRVFKQVLEDYKRIGKVYG